MLCEALGWGPPDRSIVVCVCPLPFSPMPEGCSGWDWLDGESGMTVPECGSTLPVGVFLSKSLDRPDGVVIGDCDVPPSSAFTCPLSARMAPPAMRPEKTRHEHRFIWWFLLFVKSDTQARPCYEQNSCANGEPKFSAQVLEGGESDQDTLSFVGEIVWSPWNDRLEVIAIEIALMFGQRRLRCLS